MGITIHRYTVKTSAGAKTAYTFTAGPHTTPDGAVEGPPGTALTTLQGRVVLKVPKPDRPLESFVMSAPAAREEAIKGGSGLSYGDAPAGIPASAASNPVTRPARKSGNS